MTQPPTDRTLDCRDCGQRFVFTVAEQLFYSERGARQPTRCPDCRARRRAERNAEVLAAYETGGAGPQSWSEGPGTFGGLASTVLVASRPHGGGRPTYRAVCAACGRDTEVPFQPRGGRPVFCRDCFSARRGR